MVFRRGHLDGGVRCLDRRDRLAVLVKDHGVVFGQVERDGSAARRGRFKGDSGKCAFTRDISLAKNRVCNAAYFARCIVDVAFDDKAVVSVEEVALSDLRCLQERGIEGKETLGGSYRLVRVDDDVDGNGIADAGRLAGWRESDGGIRRGVHRYDGASYSSERETTDNEQTDDKSRHFFHIDDPGYSLSIELNSPI